MKEKGLEINKKIGYGVYDPKYREIMEAFKEKLDAPIPTYYTALIKEGRMTEEDYYIKTIPNQIFIKRQKLGLIERLLKDLNSDMIKKHIIEKWDEKYKQIWEM